MSRRRIPCAPVDKRVIAYRLQRALKSKLQPATVQALSVAHHLNLDAMASGNADDDILWEMGAGMLTWSLIAGELGLGEPETDRQLRLWETVAARSALTGRVAFEAGEYDLAREGVVIMDQLAELVDHITASRCATRSNQLIKQMRSSRTVRSLGRV